MFISKRNFKQPKWYFRCKYLQIQETTPKKITAVWWLTSHQKTIQVRWTRHVGHCWRSKDELFSDIRPWTLTHDMPVLADRQKFIYISCVQTQNVVWKICQEWWTIGTDGESVREICACSITWWWWWWWWSSSHNSCSTCLSFVSITTVSYIFMHLNEWSNLYVFSYPNGEMIIDLERNAIVTIFTMNCDEILNVWWHYLQIWLSSSLLLMTRYEKFC